MVFVIIYFLLNLKVFINDIMVLGDVLCFGVDV